mgnify:CR=1 FL=1
MGDNMASTWWVQNTYSHVEGLLHRQHHLGGVELAGAILGGIRVRLIRLQTLGIVDVLEGIGGQATIASIVLKVACAPPITTGRASEETGKASAEPS